MKAETLRKAGIKIGQSLIILGFVVWVICSIKFWVLLRREREDIRRSVKSMTPIEQERLAYDLMATMFNASQTNWTMTVTITPRTNVIEKP